MSGVNIWVIVHISLKRANLNRAFQILFSTVCLPYPCKSLMLQYFTKAISSLKSFFLPQHCLIMDSDTFTILLEPNVNLTTQHFLYTYWKGATDHDGSTSGVERALSRFPIKTMHVMKKTKSPEREFVLIEAIWLWQIGNVPGQYKMEHTNGQVRKYILARKNMVSRNDLLESKVKGHSFTTPPTNDMIPHYLKRQSRCLKYSERI